MEGSPGGVADLQRTSSQTSITSVRSHKSGTVRSRSRKHSSIISESAKSLTSFPSLSPENSPILKKERPFFASPQAHSTPQISYKDKPSIVESLITSTPSFSGRSTLFSDSPLSSGGKDVPGALHLASDITIKRLVARTGVVTLIRQLAEDLAQRDAEISTFRRRAEERERELKKMLREVEVSNLDIETRLHHLDNLPVDRIQSASPKETKRNDVGRLDGNSRKSSITNGIDHMVGEAMNDDVGTIAELDEGYLDTLDNQDKYATIRASTINEMDGNSARSSLESVGRRQVTVKGWKEFLWSGTATSRKTSGASSVVSDFNEDAEAAARARAPSGGNVRRKGLNGYLFQPPQRRMMSQKNVKAPSDRERDTDASSRKSSVSVASWTMKLFAGNSNTGRDTETQKSPRGRSATTGSDARKTSRTASIASTQTASSAFAALTKVNSMLSDTRSFKKSVKPLPLGPHGTLRGPSQPASSLPPGSPASVNTSNNLGPVEMDTILPQDSKPPTLTQIQSTGQNNELLTDRFGFIYDQRRRKKESDALDSAKSNPKRSGVEMIGRAKDVMEAIEDADEIEDFTIGSGQHEQRPATPASMDNRVEEKPARKWQDYLKTATFPTELLSHTPSSGGFPSTPGLDSPSLLKRTATIGDKQGSMPITRLTPQPLASPVTASPAEIAKPSAITTEPSTKPTDTEPVKLLLAQLTELHDTLQRERTVKWNEFLRKVRAERWKEGETAAGNDSTSRYASMPEVTIADGEMIGVAGLGNKGKVGRAKWKEFQSLVLAGIPVAYRAKIWTECSGASALRVPGYYDDLISDSQNDDPVILAQIRMDINRTLTDNVFFRNGPGVSKLHEVLLAYSRRNPEVGYCQGMNLITASLLLIMPTAEDAFWVLTSIIENILPRHYYDHSLLASRADQIVLRQYVAEILPRLSTHLDGLGIELEALTFQWFLSVFTDCLSGEALFRIWDVILCFNDGSTFLFQVALALLKLNEERLMSEESAVGVYGYIGNEMTDHAISIDGLVRASDALKGVVRRGSALSVGSGEEELVVREPMPVDD